MTEQAKAFADSTGIEYAAEFVPQSKSRNAGEKAPSLNWRVTLRKNGRTLTTDYMQGCAHIPHYEQRFANLVIYDAAVRKACETGLSVLRAGQKNGYDACGGDNFWGARAKPIPPPAFVDVLASLVLDSDVIDYPRFDDWAETYGYETDSRTAEKTYRACLEIALQVRQMLDLDAAREAFQDY
jgi:hypothetical protein